MCGRFTVSVSKEELKDYLKEEYQIEEFVGDIELPRYNVAPGQKVISVINDGTQHRAGLLQWGFVPFFAKDESIGSKMINAKAETLNEKPSFKPSLTHKRCVVLADSFYEWKEEDSRKQPMRILLKDQKLFPMAGLWSTYTREDGTKLYTCSIITTSANSFMTPIHNRMPVILNHETRAIWLDTNNKNINHLMSILTPYDANQMFAYPVSNMVNNPKNDSISCITKVV